MIRVSRSHRFFVGVCLAGMLWGNAGWPQNPPQSQPSQQELESLSYAMEVELAQVAVRVTDSKGNWISGLQPADLELLEDGIPQEIKYLDEVVAPAEPAPPAPPVQTERKKFVVSSVFPTSILVVFDTSNTGKNGVEKHRQYVQNFLRNYNKPDTIFCLFLIEPTGSYQLLQNFTSDKSLLIDKINDIYGSTGGIEEKISRAGQLSNPDTIDQCTAVHDRYLQDQCLEGALRRVINQATGFAQEAQAKSVNTIKSLKEIFQLAQHVPGQKSILLVSEGFDPAGTFYMNYAANVIRYFIDYYGIPNRFNSMVSEVQAEASRTSSNITQVRTLTREANAAGVSVYWANPEYGKDVTDVGSELSTPSSFNMKLVNAPDLDSTMRGLAEDTGGAAQSSLDPSAFYKRLTDTIPRCYLVSYKPGRALNDGQYHRIQIHTKNKDYKVAYGKDFKDINLPERITNELAGAHDFPGVASRLALPFEVHSFLKSDGQYQLTIHTGLRYRDIEPQFVQSRVADDVHFSFLVRDAEGNVLFDTHPIVKIRSDQQEFLALKDAGATLEYVQNYSLKPGSYFVSLAAMDVTGWKTAGGSTWIKLPGTIERCLMLSPALLASGSTKTAIGAKQPTPNEKGNIQYGSDLFSFSLDRVFAPKGSLTGFYQIYNARSDIRTSNPSVFVSFKLYRDKTVFVNKTPEHQITAYSDPHQKLISNFYSVPYNNLAPGSYELEIEARDGINDCTAASRVPFEIASPTTNQTSK